ncbi:TRCF domain-containing protein [Enterovirga sp.]|uniref:TRCF domain-containing protein n=1 Tax=Enterovirga sp. TaxID=2026350 RepID=UPI00260E5841|nr:TRCF domain-containing protein [Enterovirga sp.]MDB5591462.1 box helicase domain protein [Enterovirga sp.]
MPPTAAPLRQRDDLSPPLPRSEGGLALLLLGLAREAGSAGLLHVAAGASRLDRLAALLWAFAPDVETFLFPPWDCLPYDRLSPSPRPMGLRIATLSALAEGRPGPFIVLGTPEALLQRVPPRGIWAGRTRTLSLGDPIDPAALARDLARTGYRADERVDEPGEFAARGAVFDVFPAGYYLPVRIDHDSGRVTAIASFDAASQRTTDRFNTLRLQPASEAVRPPGNGDETAENDAPERGPGLEHRLPDIYGRLESLLDYMPRAHVVVEPGAEDRAGAFLEQVHDAYESRLRFQRGDGRPLSPEGLYLSAAERDGQLARRTVTRLAEADPEDSPEIPVFARHSRPGDALRAFVAAEREAGRRIAVAGPEGPDLDAVARRVAKAAATAPVRAATWDDIAGAAPRSVLRLNVPLAQGFRAEPAVTVVAVRDVLGSQAHLQTGSGPDSDVFGRRADRFHLGDAVIHLDHGIGVLRGLERVAAPGQDATETIRLEYAGGAILMVPVSDLDLMWRYGAMREGLSLDRLGGEAWPRKRAKVEAEIGRAAAELSRLAAAHRAREAARLVPPRRDYERFVAGFPFAETPDQRSAVSDILADLASGHAMDRLCCGDVGFGKTEVALRAAAAAVLSGKQVALAAPTTVLVRQHLATFRRRFAELGIEVGHLSRLVAPAEARATKEGLASGRIRIAIGTHALAGRGVRFADLGLLIVDEEQRFGAADKEKLRRLGEDVHVLTLTATPIPRTMQAALAGLRAVSVLATPPAERQPVRTVVMPLDEATVRDALLREMRRGGQSFVVCPRIEDIAPMAERLARLVPELQVRVAHGQLKPAEIDETMVAFADGEGDVLLATNIIESGLDVPRANTILIWRADRFGLSQLHQLRGRVGRGRVRGTTYLLTDPEQQLPPETARRLDRLAALDRLGAGFAISAEDLDTRGGGDLLGDTQTGHVKLIGAGLYRRLLERALLAAQGTAPAEDWSPELNIGASGLIPDSYVPEPEMRLNLYARIARARDLADEDRLAEEIEDRFGPRPDAVETALALGRLRRLCRRAGVARIDAGPQAVALTFKEAPPAAGELAGLERAFPGGLSWKDARLILAGPFDPADLLRLSEAALSALSPDA